MAAKRLITCGLFVAGVTIGISLNSTDTDAQERRTDGNPKLFQYLEPSKLELSPKQQKTFSKMKGEGTAADVSIVRLDPSAFKDDTLRLNLSDGTVLEAKRLQDIQGPGRKFTWSGRISAASNDDTVRTAQFAVQDSNAGGSFATKGYTYNLRPLGNGLHALIKRDRSKLKPEEPKEAIEKLQDEGAKKQKPVPNPMAEARAATTVDVMVLFTPGVAENHPDVPQFIDSVVAITNAALQESNVPIRISLVHAAEVDYTESGSVASDVEHLSNPNDKSIDHIHPLRNKHKADIVVMLIDHADAYGMADAILADESTAFAVVDDEVADWYFSFAHELGHLFGCRHNPDADPNTAPFPYGHCICMDTKEWRTIMSYDCTGQSTRIGIWSSPLLRHPKPNGDQAGTPHTHDNCRVLRETAATIAAFR